MISRVLSVFRPGSPDRSTSKGRSSERQRRAVLTTVTTAGATGVTVLTSLVSVPLTVSYLGVERYGMWMTISSLITILRFADLGLGNGLLNAVAEAYGRDDHETASEYVSSAFYLLSGIALVLAVAFAIGYSRIPWPQVFNVTSQSAASEAGPAVAAFMTCFLLSIPLGVVQRTQLGYQEGFINGIVDAAGRLLGLVGVLLAITMRAGLPWLVLAMSGGPVVAALLNAIEMFGCRRRSLRPHLHRMTRSATRKVLSTGLLFFVLEVVGALAFASDNLVIAQVLGASAVTLYAVPMKLYQMLESVLGVVLNPLWPAYGEAAARQDNSWIRKTFGKSLGFSALFSALGSLILVVFGSQIVELWTGSAVVPSTGLLLGLGVWTTLKIAGAAVAVFLNGIGVIGFQTVTAVLMGASALILKVLLSRAVGLPGIAWATTIAYVVCVAIPMMIYVPRLMRKALPSQDRSISV